MKRDLIYLTLIVSAIWAAHATAKAVQDGPQQIEPRKIEAGFTKTVHILFPSPVTYIDIGSMDIIAGKADGAENVVRVKAAVRNFAAETNLTVITEDGGFFTFDVHYAENPVVSTLNLTVQDQQTESVKEPAAAGDPQPAPPASEGRVLLREVGREKPATVKRMLSDIYRQNRTDVKGIRTKKYGIEVEVLDLDHDLGDFANQGGDAIKLLDWLAERETFYPVEIHTANPVGRANMESVLARYWGEDYW